MNTRLDVAKQPEETQELKFANDVANELRTIAKHKLDAGEVCSLIRAESIDRLITDIRTLEEEVTERNYEIERLNQIIIKIKGQL